VIFRETKLPGAYRIELARHEDERGYFARTWCQCEFAAHGLRSAWVQCSTSYSKRKGTLRGLHYQHEPFAEEKLIRCTRGALYDVILDLRPASPTFRQWLAVELSERNSIMLYLPTGLAHGFQTLADDTEVFYQISQFYHPEAACGVRWNDPAFAIDWPPGPRIISARDQQYADYAP
jgi:dTDP-4-dehydrorhamnose 3,5-epimerase